jgi:hypothetical protein
MRTAFAMLAGGAIGALAIQGLHAQQTGAQQQLPKVVYVAEVDISDPSCLCQGLRTESAANDQTVWWHVLGSWRNWRWLPQYDPAYRL